MARLSIFDDTVAHICWKYIHGEYGAKINETIYYATAEIVPYQWEIYIFIMEIAYRTGYANSILGREMSEVTYKKKKKAIRDNIKRLIERANNEQGTEKA